MGALDGEITVLLVRRTSEYIHLTVYERCYTRNSFRVSAKISFYGILVFFFNSQYISRSYQHDAYIIVQARIYT